MSNLPVFEKNTHRSYDPKFFSELAEIEEKHFWFRTRNDAITTLTRQFTKDWRPGYRVLEVGCGTGNVLRALERSCPDGVVVGMDLFAEGLLFARRRTACALVQGDLEQPGFGVAFDLVGAFDVVEHLPDDMKIFCSLHSMLRPGGVLLVTVPAYQSLWSYFDEVSHHCRRYEPQELRHKLSDTGFEVEFLSPFLASIFPLLWFVRRIKSLHRTKESMNPAQTDREKALGELRVVPGVNGLLNLVLRQETKLIGRRRVLPFGSSLIAAARRKT